MIEETTLKINSMHGSQRFNQVLQWALALFFFLLPWQTRYIFYQPDPGFEYGTLSLFAIEVLVWIVIVLGVLQMPRLKIKDLGFKRLLALLVLSFVSIAWAVDTNIALQAGVRLMAGVLLFIVIDKSSIVNRKALVYAFIAGAVIQALLGIYQFLFQSSFALTLLGMAEHDPAALGTAVVEFGDQRWLRAYGGLPHPNVLGGYLAIAIAVAIAVWQKVQGWQRLILQSSIFVLLTGLFFSFSRAAWIAAAVVVLIGLMRPVGQIRRVLVVGWIVLLVGIYWPLVCARVMPVERLEVKSRVERVEGIQESWELIKKHPVLGVGIGNYTQAVGELRLGDPLYSYQPVHNVFLLIWAEIGIVGLLLFLGALYWAAKRSKLLLVLFILLLFDHYLWSLPFGVFLLWGVLGYKKEKPF